MSSSVGIKSLLVASLLLSVWMTALRSCPSKVTFGSRGWALGKSGNLNTGMGSHSSARVELRRPMKRERFNRKMKFR